MIRRYWSVQQYPWTSRDLIDTSSKASAEANGPFMRSTAVPQGAPLR